MKEAPEISVPICAFRRDEMKFRTIASTVVLMLVSSMGFAQSSSQNPREKGGAGRRTQSLQHV